MMMMSVVWWTLVAAAVAVGAVGVVRGVLAARRRVRFGGTRVVGFFHPYCNSGGGGERVLWQCIHALQAMMTKDNRQAMEIVVFTGDTASPEAMLSKASRRFNLPEFPMAERIRFVRVRSRRLVEAELYPHFTMLGQSLGSMVLALECLLRLTPHVFVDTTGYAFSYPLANLLGGCTVASYTHYPTISTDMLARVYEQRPTYNNRAGVANSTAASRAKALYYRLFALLYGVVGRFAHVVMVNSTWTFNHISSLWAIPKRTHIVYPPCDTTTLRKMPLNGERGSREPLVVSVGQFRPEKDHMLQLESFRLFLQKRSKNKNKNESKSIADGEPRLVMIGGCRNEGDQARVDELRRKADRWGIGGQVDIKTNIPFPELLAYLGRGLVGIHTMWNEHFGIGVVEFMAAGVVTLAHASGGPKADIVVDVARQRTGYLASTAEEYADAMSDIFAAYYDRGDRGRAELDAMRVAARQHSTTFSDERFLATFTDIIKQYL